MLRDYGLGHQRVRPHRPQKNGFIERAYRTVHEELDGDAMTSYYAAQDALANVIRRYNHERLHSELGYVRPIEYFRGESRPLTC